MPLLVALLLLGSIDAPAAYKDLTASPHDAGARVTTLIRALDDAGMQESATVLLAANLLWIVAAYQVFDGLKLSSVLCLRGAGDATVPATVVLSVAFLLFTPMAHSFTFAPGQGWVSFLPQFGWGVYGGWSAVVLDLMVLGTTMFVRWRSGIWKTIRL